MINSRKVLILRFSAFGDVIQSLSIPAHIKKHWPEAEIHCLTRKDFSPLFESHPQVTRVWTIKRGQKLIELFHLIKELRAQKFTHVYDAHNNLRSHLICWGLTGSIQHFLRRSMMRWKRILLFRFRINKFEMPFSGQRDLLKPLEAWGLPFSLPPAPQLHLPNDVIVSAKTHLKQIGLTPFFCLAPSAAHILKRWPERYWRELIEKNQNIKFVILGGPEDRFIENLIRGEEHHAVSFAGQLNLLESSACVALSQGLISNDTGLLHVAEQLGKKAIALMGPAPFGFPSRRATTLILEKELYCRPCSKHGQGPCVNPNYQECLTSFTSDFVSLQMKTHFSEAITGSAQRNS